MFVIDGAKALSEAICTVFGDAPVQSAQLITVPNGTCPLQPSSRAS